MQISLFIMILFLVPFPVPKLRLSFYYFLILVGLSLCTQRNLVLFADAGNEVYGDICTSPLTILYFKTIENFVEE